MKLAIVLFCLYVCILVYVVRDYYSKKRNTAIRALIGKIAPLLWGFCLGCFMVIYTEPLKLSKTIVTIILYVDMSIYVLSIFLCIGLFIVDIWKKKFLFLKSFGVYLVVAVIPVIVIMIGYNVLQKMNFIK
jgi:hypothetical protein